jgi:DNA gyrase subunit A
MVVNERNGPIAAAFPVEHSDQIILVTDAGQLIRTSVDQVRIAGRNTQGVRIFRTGPDEKVVSVERIPEVANGENGSIENGNDDAEGQSGDEGGVSDNGGTPGGEE